MKTIVVKQPNEGGYFIFCPDKTIKRATEEALREYFLNFKELEKNSLFQKGNCGNWSEETLSEETLTICSYITKNNELVILDNEPFKSFFAESEYVSAIEYAKMHDTYVEVVKKHCMEQRIIGAKRINNRWIIPKDSPYPEKLNIFSNKEGTYYKGVIRKKSK